MQVIGYIQLVDINIWTAMRAQFVLPFITKRLKIILSFKLDQIKTVTRFD